MGYRYGRFVERNTYSNQPACFRMTEIPGNTGIRGFWVTKMTTGIVANPLEIECYNWYVVQSQKGIPSPWWLTCPCSGSAMRFLSSQFALYRIDAVNNVGCYVSITFGSSLECCYQLIFGLLGPLSGRIPEAGSVLSENPFFQPREYYLNNWRAKVVCCASGHCDWYYNLRPRPSVCLRRIPVRTAWFFGDPHINTLDGGAYTFNGYGEYTMMKIDHNGTKFELQARTDLTTNANGTKINATIFSAFVAKDQTGSVVQVEMSKSRTRMYVRGNGRDLTTDFENNPDYILRTLNLSLSKDNGTYVASFVQSGSINSSTSLFHYDTGLSHSNYSHPDFVPFFIDEVEEEKVNEAKQVCGGNNAPKACIFDFLATGDTSLAKSSGADADSSAADSASLENEIPNIEGDTEIQALVNKSVEIKFNASDDGTYTYEVLKKPPGFSFNNLTGIATWTPQDTNIANISVTVVDNKGEQAAPVDVAVILCSGCSGRGTCNYNDTLSSASELFKYAKCICDIGYTGQDCENDIDGCAQSPCAQGRNCTDLTPEEERVQGRGYNCSDCPTGYFLSDNKCEDTNECNSSATNSYINECEVGGICSQDCQNSVGSFTCSCFAGFTLDQDKTTCLECEPPNYGVDCQQTCTCGKGMDRCDPVTGCVCKSGWTGSNCDQDVNECTENPNICGSDKICQNLEGSYSCNCRTGLEKVSDNCIDIDECDNAASNNCSTAMSVCTNNIGGYTCTCKSGFNNKNPYECEDFDECEAEVHGCTQNCVNVDGGFNCECEFGYTLDDDRKTCIEECNGFTYGENCATPCNCGVGSASCDKVRGCVCSDGWTGEKCDLDKNECASVNPCTGINEECRNSPGSYMCVCVTGYEKNTTTQTCQDIDECSPNPCSENCTQNAAGAGYTCSCAAGKRLDVDQRTCVDCEGWRYGPECASNCTCDTQNTISCEKVSGSCACKSGWEGPTCQSDINECQNTTICPINSECLNSNGSYSCICNPGYAFANGKCVGCSSTTYGQDCANQCTCDITNSRSCDKQNGTCYCNDGWTGVNCTEDIRECDNNQNICGANANCSEIPGSYVCNCNPGFKKDASGVCEDVNECVIGTDNCDAHANCTNSIGSFSCACNTGFSGNGSSCTPLPTTTSLVTTETTAQRSETTSESLTSSIQSTQTSPEIPEPTTRGTERTSESSEPITHSTRSTPGSPAQTTQSTRSSSESQSLTTQSTGSSSESPAPTTQSTGSSSESPAPTTQSTGSSSENTAPTTQSTSTSESQAPTTQSTGSSSESPVPTTKSTGSSSESPAPTTQSTGSSSESPAPTTQSTKSSSVSPAPTTQSTSTTESPQQSTPEVTTQGKIEPYVPEENEVKLGVVLTFEDNIDLSDYDTVKQNMGIALSNFYSKKIKGFIKVIIRLIRRGSTIVEHDIVANRTDDTEQDIAQTVISLSKGENKVEYNNGNLSTDSVAVDDGSGNFKNITSSSSRCDIYVVNNPCKPGEQCIESGNRVYCSMISDDYDEFKLIVGLGVGIPLFFTAVLIFTIVIVFLRRHRYKENSLSSSDDNDDYLDRNMFGGQGTYFSSGIPTKIDSWGRQRSPYSPHHGYQTAFREKDGFDDVTRGGVSPMYDDPVQSNFSWDFMYQALHPNEKFEIKRPEIRTKPLNTE
ncbi:uncharacterized protein LOC133197100 [Saccostrea echinata]|uniref:uncharacterized protein LOC133197100 n=1 Tax=Saccostrea echinata TaxID=191078 RepID=UPI002A7F5775|nr:uncharacterized protein LOC133197100 [Saccostrea echinata]